MILVIAVIVRLLRLLLRRAVGRVLGPKFTSLFLQLSVAATKATFMEQVSGLQACGVLRGACRLLMGQALPIIPRHLAHLVLQRC